MVSYQDVIQAHKKYRDYIAMYTRALFFGEILKILCMIFPATEASFGRRR